MKQLMLNLAGIKSEKKLLMPEEEIKATLKKKTKLGKCGCPFWKYNFEERHSECRLSGESRPDEGADNLFRCDFDYNDCKTYRQAVEVIK